MSTPMTAAEKKQIDDSSYVDLLRNWRFSPTGDPVFSGESGEYYVRVMQKKRETMGPAEHTRVSKEIGWSR